VPVSGYSTKIPKATWQRVSWELQWDAIIHAGGHGRGRAVDARRGQKRVGSRWAMILYRVAKKEVKAVDAL
jgi:hypothetical protein